MAAAGEARAGPQVFVNNQPFPGRVAGSGAEVLLEAEALFRQLGLEFVVDGGAAVAEGLSVPLVERDGVAMVSAVDVARATGGRVLAQPQTGTVDLYAHDVARAGREAWERVFVQAEVASDFDLQVLAWTTRRLLEEDLGMALDDRVPLRLADPAAMARAGLPSGALGGLVDGPAFLFREKSAPLSVISTMAFNWGVLWARQAGAPDLQGEGLGLWASYSVLRRLGLDPARRTYGDWQGAAPQALFLHFCSLQDEGGPQAVLEAVRRSGSSARETPTR